MSDCVMCKITVLGNETLYYGGGIIQITYIILMASNVPLYDIGQGDTRQQMVSQQTMIL